MIARETRCLLASALVAVGVPAGIACWLEARTDALADRLAAAAGVPATIGRVDADLSGAVRLDDVALGDLVRAESIEASVGMGSLLDGELRADEIRVEAPHVALRLDRDGDSDLARLVRKLAQHRAPSTAGGSATRIRRIVVDRGTLTARVEGIGELAADDVELVPDATGVRIITGAVRVHGSTRLGRSELAIDLAFARSAADVSLPQLRFSRMLAVGGGGSIGAPDQPPLVLRDVAAGRRVRGGPLELVAEIEDRPDSTRRLAATLSPSDLAITLRGERVPLRVLRSFAPHGLVLDDAIASGRVTLHPGSTVGLSVDATLDHLAIAHPAFAPEPVTLGGRVRGDLVVSRDAIAVSSAGLTLGAIDLAASGWWRRGQPMSGRIALSLSSAPCADLLAAIPESLRGPVDGMAVSGSLGADAQLVVDLAAPDGDGAHLQTTLRGGCTVAVEPPAADVTTLVTTTDQQLADGSRAKIGPDAPDWTPLRALPSHVVGAFVSAEDGRFWDHAGFDLQQITRSLEIDLREHRLARGGSTISQQLVKNAFLTQRRSFDRKLQEAILTWRLEDKLDKKQILERYLNIIELGPRTFGLAAAARYWFATTPRELTVRQAAFLAALTSQPASMTRRVRRAGGLDPESAERVAVVLRAMKRDGVISSDAFEAAKAAGLDFAASVVAER
ncbi:MAG TPA: biosynthetic peptidoglycan transglycosylase [Kofleriaceae bacterium]|nr:biosynthetic peptidoglycan transglycosylase [Kofleriaceae bacterium]